MLVREAMSTTPATITAQTSIKQALTILDDRNVTALPVLDGTGHLCGIVSEVDLIQDLVARDPRALERPITIEPLGLPLAVEDVYTRAVVTVAPEDDIIVAVELMTETGVKSLPVVDGNRRLKGIISRRDIVKALARTDETIASDVTRLTSAIGHPDWLVEVEDGVVSITGPQAPGEASLARTVAQTVAGVIDVRVPAV